MDGVDDGDDFRDADDGAGTAPPPSSSPARAPSNSKPAAAAGGFGRRLLASIGLPTSFSAAIGRSVAPSSSKPPAPQPPVGPNLGLGLLLHHYQDPSPSADGSLVSDASAPDLHPTPTADLQKRHEEVLGEQGAAEDGENQVIGHDVSVGEGLAVLVRMQEEGQEKEDVAEGCSEIRNGYSPQDLDEGEQYKSDELGAAIKNQEVMEQEEATEYYTACEDQSNNYAEQCTGDAPTTVKDDSAVEGKNEAMEQEYAAGVLVTAEIGFAGGLQKEDEQCEDDISVKDHLNMVEQCRNDELGVTIGDGWLHDLEEALVGQEGLSEHFDAAVEDQSNNADLEQCSSDELRVVKDENVVEDKEKAAEVKGAIGTLGASKDGIAVGLRKEDVMVEDKVEDDISLPDQDKVVEQCMSDELGVSMGDKVMVEQEGLTEHFDAAMEDQIDTTALEQRTSDELRVIKDVENTETAVEQEASIDILGTAENDTAMGLREEDLVVESQGEHGFSVQDQDKVVEQGMRDDLGVAMDDSAIHDQEVVVLEQVGVVECFNAAMENLCNKAAMEQCTSDELGEIKSGNFLEENVKAVEQEGAICQLDAADDGASVRERDVVVEGQGENDISVQDKHNVLDQCTSDEPGVAMGGNTIQDHDLVVNLEDVTEYLDAVVEGQSNNAAVEQCTHDDVTGGQEEGEVVVSLQDQRKVVEQCTIDQVRTTADFNDLEVAEQEGAILPTGATVDSIVINAQEKAVEQSAGDESRATEDAEDKEKVVDQGGLTDKQDAIKGDYAVEPQGDKDVAAKEQSEDDISVRDQDKMVEQCLSDPRITTMDDNAAEDQEVKREKIRLCVGYPQRPGRPNCRVYMSTGSCSYGLSCYLNHPQAYLVPSSQLKARPEVPNFSYEQENREVAQILELNRVGLPIRENARNCMYYMRNGSCRYGKRCCFNHPEHVLDVQLYKPTGWDDTNMPSSPRSKKSSSPPSKKSSELATLDDISSNSEILPSNILRMLLPPQTMPPGTEAKEMKDPDWSYASDDSDGSCSANSSGEPLCKEEHHVGYPKRPAKQECPFLLRYGNCKFASSCHYYHPNDKFARRYCQKDLSLSELMVYPDKPGAPECPFYMKTGACKFRSECKFHHPKDLPPTMQDPTVPKRPVDAKEPHPETKTTQEHMDQQQNYPERPGQPECRYFMQFGKCKFLSACIFHHPKDRVPSMPECPFYMKTGSCQFGSACEFYHSSKGGEIDDGTEYGHGYPQRPGGNECSHYMKYGYCKFQMNCKFHHPTDRLSRN